MGWNTDILDDDNISANARLIYFALSKFADKDGKCYPSFATLAKKTKLTDRTIRKYIPELIKNNWIRKEQRKKEGGAWENNLYILHRLGVRKEIPKGTEGDSEGVRNQFPTNLSNITYPYNYNNINIVEQVINYLNDKTGKSYKSKTSKTKSLINARLKDGFTFEDFKKVIDIKSKEWLTDKAMNKYLRPETLFGGKFEGYLNQENSNLDDDEKYSHLNNDVF